jgi:hypothetical protein
MALNLDGVAVVIVLEGIRALILDAAGDACVILTGANIVFQLSTSASGCGLPTETQLNGSQDCALATTVFAADEVDQRPEIPLLVLVTHEVDCMDRLKDTGLDCHVVFGSDELSRSLRLRLYLLVRVVDIVVV